VNICRVLKRLMLMAFFGLVITSCGGLLESKQVPDRTYLITPYMGASTPASTGRSLSVEVSVISSLDSDRLITLSNDAELNHLSGIKWPDYLPEYLNTLLIQSLESAGQFDRVSDARSAGPDYCDLKLEAREFYVKLNQSRKPASVSIVLSGEFMCGDYLLPIRLGESAGVSGENAAAIIAAFQAAMDRTSQSLHQELAAAEIP
jgi:ABC-type uncharacterized transport system auxiliary subunit